MTTYGRSFAACFLLNCGLGTCLRFEPRSADERQSIAILMSGRLVHVRGMMDITDTDLNIFDWVTGEEDLPREEAANATSASRGVNFLDASAKTEGLAKGRLWDSIEEHLVQPLKAVHDVDLFLCLDTKFKGVPPSVTHFYAFGAEHQFDRVKKCFERVQNRGKQYDWFIKARPDFLFHQHFPDPRTYDPNYLYTRLRFAQGIAGLTSREMSYKPCEEVCNGEPEDGVGYVNDDMMWLVPRAIAPAVFDVEGANMSRKFHLPGNWISMPETWQEVRFTRALLHRGILTKPLSLSGCPVGNRARHCQLNAPCVAKVILKQCGPRPTPIEKVHEMMLAAGGGA